MLYTTSIKQECEAPATKNFRLRAERKWRETFLVRKQENLNIITKPSPFGGAGTITVRDILETPDEMYQKGRVFCHTTVYAGSALGYHVHKGESETYYILSGHGTFNDNGTLVEVGPGDVLFTGDQEGHSIQASCGEDIELIALILYK